MSEHLSKEDLEYFKQRLQMMRERNQEQIDENEGPNDSLGELANYDNHPGDIGTEQFEQQRDAGLEMMRQEQLQEIEDALKRIEDGSYGYSQKSGKPIPFERLEAQPTAKYLVEEE
ncbi:TraR/DksA C4-type zinc finger protein [Virgibacillus kimchii]